jgi:hypothetical protein
MFTNTIVKIFYFRKVSEMKDLTTLTYFGKKFLSENECWVIYSFLGGGAITIGRRYDTKTPKKRARVRPLTPALNTLN